jgi:hypothetical protein
MPGEGSVEDDLLDHIHEENIMRLNPPKKITFWIAILVALVGFVLYALSYAGVIGIAWVGLVGVLLLAAAFILLVLGLMVKGL